MKVPLTDDATGGLTAEAVRVLGTLKAGGGHAPTVFVGSGVSIWRPSELPSGQDFTRAMFSILFDGALPLSSAERSLLEGVFGKKWSPHFSGMPFEHLMECCPSEEKGNALVNRLYDARRPNPLHRALARGLKEGKVHAIITTNYDCCLDEALDGESFAYVKAVTPAQARAALGLSPPRYFKIHGSVEMGLESTPMFSLRHEGLLHPDKRALLSELASGRTLLMIGYSGLDFELCPEIERLDLRALVWNNLKDYYPSVSAERLIGVKKGLLLHGDMRELIKVWLGLTSCPDPAPPMEHEVLRTVQGIFTSDEISAWRVRVLNSLGLPAFASRALKVAGDPRASSFYSVERGRAHFHAGRYRAARRWFQRAFIAELAARRWEAAADAALETSDAYRTYGAPLRAYACTWAVDLFAAKRWTAKKLLKQSLIIRDAAEVAGALRKLLTHSSVAAAPLERLHRVLAGTLRQAMETKLLKCAKEALRTGNWIDFQQVSLIAEGSGLDLSAASSGEFYTPPPAAAGYRHLGYYIPQTMVFMNACLSDKSLLATSAQARREWRHHVKLCTRLGINSSLWKVLALHPSRRVKAEARNVFRLCEYGRLKGLLDWKKYAA